MRKGSSDERVCVCVYTVYRYIYDKSKLGKQIQIFSFYFVDEQQQKHLIQNILCYGQHNHDKNSWLQSCIDSASTGGHATKDNFCEFRETRDIHGKVDLWSSIICIFIGNVFQVQIQQSQPSENLFI